MRDGVRQITMPSDGGFTLVELMLVVLIIGLLASIAIPVFVTSASHAEKRTCFGTQRTIEGVISIWQLDPVHTDVSMLAGDIGASHPLITGRHLVHPPRCPAAPSPANPSAPTAAEGVYSLDASGNVVPCTFGDFGSHGSFRDQ